MGLSNGSVNRQLLSHLGDKKHFLSSPEITPPSPRPPPKVCGLKCACGHRYRQNLTLQGLLGHTLVKNHRLSLLVLLLASLPFVTLAQ